MVGSYLEEEGEREGGSNGMLHILLAASLTPRHPCFEENDA